MCWSKQTGILKSTFFIPIQSRRCSFLRSNDCEFEVYRKLIIFPTSSSPPPPDLLSRIDLDELMKKDEPPLEFPDTLEGFEYAFNESKFSLERNK